MPIASSTDVPCVYCAGPLFNQAERKEMTAIADVLCGAGYRVYLPHRDGMEFRLVHKVLVERGRPATEAAAFLHNAIFALDVYQLTTECDGMVWNLNGRVPDEGAVAEAAICWTLGKPLVAYRDDVRSLIAGRLNPLLVGLVDFQTIDDIAALPQRFAAALDEASPGFLSVEDLPPKLQRTVHDGETLWAAMREQEVHERDSSESNAILADLVTDLFAPQTQAAR